MRGLVLVDPAAPVSNWFTVRPHAAARLSTPLIPGVAGHLIDLYRNTQTPEQAVDEALEFVAEHPERLSPIVRRDALEIAELRRSHEWSTPVLIEAVRSIAPYVVRKAPFARMLHRIGQPTLLVHGTEDALIQIETARWMARQRPDWTHAFFEGVGHVPMLEVPDALLEVFATWEAAVFGEDASVDAEKP